MAHALNQVKRRRDDRSEGAEMEPVWVLLRCYRTVPNAACNVLGVYSSAGSAIADAKERQNIPVDAWKSPGDRDEEWSVESQVYAYKLEAFMIPAAGPAPLQSIEVDTIH
jgi:hypothetical protein